MPEQPDGGLVPPVKILRKRVNGVYRADGFAGPTRRYVLVVAMLVGLASLPTLAAITAGTNELDRDTTGAMDVPFLPPPSPGPVVPTRPAPSPSAGVVHGEAGERRTLPQRYGQSDAPSSGATAGVGRRSGSRSGSSASERRPERAGSTRPQRSGAESGGASSMSPPDGPSGRPGHSAPPSDGGSGRPGHAAPPSDDGPGRPGPPPNDGSVPPGHAVPPNKPTDRGRPADPEEQAPPPLRP
ncbi:MAG TPA: hypothetical protein VH502_04765, partial [Actinoplanes sp.]